MQFLAHISSGLKISSISWADIGDKSSVELQLPALHDALTTIWKRISKSNICPIANKHKILFLQQNSLLQHSKVELFLNELAHEMCQPPDKRNHVWGSAAEFKHNEHRTWINSLHSSEIKQTNKKKALGVLECVTGNIKNKKKNYQVLLIFWLQN